jgi:hypothetical protein
VSLIQSFSQFGTVSLANNLVHGWYDMFLPPLLWAALLISHHNNRCMNRVALSIVQLMVHPYYCLKLVELHELIHGSSSHGQFDCSVVHYYCTYFNPLHRLQSKQNPCFTKSKRTPPPNRSHRQLTTGETNKYTDDIYCALGL